MTDTDRTFATELRAEMRGMTQAELAESIGASQQSISDLLTGRVQPHRSRTTMALVAKWPRLLRFLRPAITSNTVDEPNSRL